VHRLNSQSISLLTSFLILSRLLRKVHQTEGTMELSNDIQATFTLPLGELEQETMWIMDKYYCIYKVILKKIHY